MYKIVAANIYEDLYKNKELFNFSNEQEDSKFYNNANNLVESKMKDETYDVPIKDF